MTLIKRIKTKRVYVGNVPIGNEAPIAVQSMTNTKTENIKETIKQIKDLEKAGCEIVRVAVPNKNSAKALHYIKKKISIPVIADIHFDYKLALGAAKHGADALRFNPGNIKNKTKINKLINCAKKYKIPIRIGVNGGSLEKKILNKYHGITAKGLVESALNQIKLLQEFNFNNIKISVKASDIGLTIEAYRLLSLNTFFPIHVGVTETGSSYAGIIKSSIGIGTLLSEGIGDTIRVSLTDNPAKEVLVGFEILKSLSIRKKGPEIISCPTCGRCEIDLLKLVKRINKNISKKKISIKIAIMGCMVNGPGEAKTSDIGISINKKTAIIFKKGKRIKKISTEEILNFIVNEVNILDKQKINSDQDSK